MSTDASSDGARGDALVSRPRPAAMSQAECACLAQDRDADRRCALIVGAWTAAMAIVTLAAHKTPLYYVETDLLGEYIPAARELAAGVINGAHYTFKGPGYPALLAIVMSVCRDAFLAARLLSVVAAGMAGWVRLPLVSRRGRG